MNTILLRVFSWFVLPGQRTLSKQDLHGKSVDTRRLSIKPKGTSAPCAHTRVFWMREAIARHQPIDQFERAIDLTAINYSKGERSAIG